jgi:hypothetical protein
MYIDTYIYIQLIYTYIYIYIRFAPLHSTLHCASVLATHMQQPLSLGIRSAPLHRAVPVCVMRSDSPSHLTAEDTHSRTHATHVH